MGSRRRPRRLRGASPVLAAIASLVLLAGIAPAAAGEATPPSSPPTTNGSAEPLVGSAETGEPTDGSVEPDQPSPTATEDPTPGPGEQTEPNPPEAAEPAEPTAPGEPGPSDGAEEPGEDEEPARPDGPATPQSTPAPDAEPSEPTEAEPSPDESPRAENDSQPGAKPSPQAEADPAADAAPTGIRLEPEQSLVTAGERVTFTVWADGEPGTSPTDVTAEAAFEFVGESGSCAGHICHSDRVGSFVVKATYAGLSDLAALNTRPGEPVGLALTPGTSTALRNQTRTFRPVLRDEFGNSVQGLSPAVDYEFDDALDCTIAASVTCSSATVGTHTVTATLRDDPTQQATSTLVVEPGNGVISDLTVELSTNEPTAGETFEVTVRGKDTEGETVDVTAETELWLVLSDANASIDIPGECGTGSCSIEAAGRFAVYATHRNLVAEARVEVTPAPVTALRLDPAESHVEVGQVQFFAFRAFDQFGNEVSFDRDEAEFTTEPAMLCEASACLPTEPGRYVIRASALGLSTSAELWVHPSGNANPADVARIAVAPATPTTTAGAAAELVVYGFDAEDRPLGRITDSVTLAIEGAGSWTTPAGTQTLSCADTTCTATVAGEHTVTATFRELTATTTLVVTPDYDGDSGTGLAPGNAVVTVGERQRYEFGSVDRYGNRVGSGSMPFRPTMLASEGATCDGQTCWSDTPGTYVIGMDLSDLVDLLGQEMDADLNWTYRAVLTVLPPAVDRIDVTPDAARVAAGERVTLTATAYDAADNVIGDVTDDTTFTAEGPMSCTANICRSTVAGSYAIEGDHEGLVDSADVTVTAAAPAEDLLTPTEAAIRVGESVDYTITRVDEFDNVIGTVTDDYTFAASDGAACEVARCTSRVTGEHTVTAMAPDQPDLTARFTVSLPDSSYLVIAPDTVTVAAGAAGEFTAALHDASGNPIADVTAETTFAAGEGAECTAAECTSTAAGTYAVTGRYDGLTDDATLTVTAAAVDQITISPDSATIDAGGTQEFGVEGFDEFGNPVGDFTTESTFAITGAGTCAANECGADQGGDFTVTASYVVPIDGETGPTGPTGRIGFSALRRDLQAAAPGETLTAIAALTVRAPDDGDDGDDGGPDDPGNGGDDEGGDNGSDNGGDDGSDEGDEGSAEDDGDQSADDTGAAEDDVDSGGSALPAAGATLAWWHVSIGLLLLVAGLALVRRTRRTERVTA